ncbi:MULTISPECIES: twin-arginine translocase TatA/TatE family subunit [Methylobacterium]|jgi:sec-independent protein translocase protein TatA|uniref:Sec-independent protein translocase protein TatA n=1 Tax=Methylobacterium isbiliense TaxID=315478 RepID=A0ABQ4S861_9HYPH|nr:MULTISPECIES: twin-arginine translocase TatA/TatE family subunit [Methylobacterium]MBY0298047.1 twin-arginine translocase TatA/TatE family subunit [Methylobacterium sp.]MDN3626823.1 twin-arginine translocase TatA/TatE family subunit [Methylobacterium isbiliense]GJD98635.1 Sec-independent protein translocase protein TatA [Methylobacterium isbiliense]
MGGASIWHWIVVGVIVMLLFGRGKVSELMGDVAKGIKAFKKGMADEDQPQAPAVNQSPPPVTATEPVRTLPPHPVEPVPAATTPADRKVG